jgi:hypothetical protein
MVFRIHTSTIILGPIIGTQESKSKRSQKSIIQLKLVSLFGIT